MNLRFSGNLALVLGGSSEAAIAAARLMLDAEITPVLSYRSRNGLEKILSEFRLQQQKIKTVRLDFSDPETLGNLESELADPPDYLVDFANEDYERLVCSACTEDVYAYFGANVSFRAAILKQVGRAMLQRKKGRFVFVSSAAAARPNPGQGFYAAAKLASEALYRSVGMELGRCGITAVVLRPGYVDAGRGRRYLQANGEKFPSNFTAKRALTIGELAENVLFLLSETAAGLNATEITLDRGLTAGKNE